MTCTPHHVNKSRRQRWVKYTAHTGERRGTYKFWWGTLREREHLEDPGIDGRIILRWIFRMWDEGAWAGLIWLRIRRGGRLL